VRGAIVADSQWQEECFKAGDVVSCAVCRVSCVSGVGRLLGWNGELVKWCSGAVVQCVGASAW
jgi:hypothetical protein